MITWIKLPRELLFFLLLGVQLSSFSFDLEKITVDGFKEEREENLGTSSFYQIPNGEIAREGSISLSSLLRDNPSVHVSSQGGAGSVSQVSLRGLRPEYTLVMIDGVIVNDPSTPTDSFHMGQLDALDIEKIEILPGSKGFLHGSDAIGGVINIVTKSPRSNGGRWKLFGNTLAGVGGKISQNFSNQKNMGARVSAHFYRERGRSAAAESLGNTEKDGVRKAQVNLKGFWEMGRGLSLDYSSQYSHQRVELDNGGGAGQDDPNHEEIDILMSSKVFLRYEGMGEKEHIFKVGLSHTFSKRENENLKDPVHPMESLSLYTGHHVNTELLYEYNGPSFHIFSGGHYRFERGIFYGENSGRVFENDTFDHISYGVNGKISQPSRSPFLWELGGRFTGNPDLESSFTYLLGLGYRFSQFKIWGNLSTGFKNPSLFQLFSANYGNKNLMAQKSQSFEFGGEYQFNPQRKISLNIYKMHVFDEIEFINNRYENRGELNSQGIELFYSFSFARYFRGSLWGNFLHLDEKILRKPKWKWGGKLRYRRNNWELEGRLRFVGRRDDQNFTLNQRVSLESYQSLDIFFRYRLQKNLLLGLSAFNIFNADNNDVYGFTPRGRKFLFSLEGKF